MANKAAAPIIDVGTVIGGTYEIMGLIGKGGMGSVWQARHQRLEGSKWAIKVLHAEVAKDAESLARFRREAMIASRLGHPNIVQVIDVNELPDGSPYLVLEYLEGESLADRIARGPLSTDETMALVRQIGSALQAAHRANVVHRDLKPQNVFLCPTEAHGYATIQAKVLDFGISKIRDSQTVQTQTATLLGTPQYMAPEQAMGRHNEVDARTDIFSLGVMLYEMLSGKPPFTGVTIPEVVFKVVYEEPASLSSVAPQVPASVAQAVHRAMAKKQEERFADISAFVEALTGDPLITARGVAVPGSMQMKAMAGSTANTGRRAAEDAFAATMAPGASEAAALGVAATMAPVQTGMGGAATMAPVQAVSHMGTAAPLAGTAAGMPASMAITAQSAPRSSRSVLFVGAGVAVLAAAAIAFVVARRPDAGEQAGRHPRPGAAAMGEHPHGGPRGDHGGMLPPGPPPGAPGHMPPGPPPLPGHQPPPGHLPPGAESGSAAAGGPEGTEASAHDKPGSEPDSQTDTQASSSSKSGSKSSNSGKSSSSTEASDRDSGRDSGEESPADEPASGEARELLEAAQAALAAGNGAEAVRLATKAMPDAPRAAAVLITKGYCQERDLGGAQAYYQRVPRLARRSVRNFCARHNVDLP